MRAIVFKNYINNINGSVLNAIEYYLAMLIHNSSIRLLIINYNSIFQNKLEALIKDRYNTIGLDFKSNIINLNYEKDLLHYSFDRLLILDYSTLSKVRGLIKLKNNKSKIIIISELHTDNPNFMIDKSLYPKGCVEYYGEMPFVYKDYQYTMKFLFSRYCPTCETSNNVFIHSPNNTNYNFVDELELPEHTGILFKTGEHKNKLFSLFNTFVYYHAGKWFDPHPRLMVESYFYGKKILYYNYPNVIDGSYYRYTDLIKNGIDHRYLDKDDEIVRNFID